MIPISFRQRGRGAKEITNIALHRDSSRTIVRKSLTKKYTVAEKVGAVLGVQIRLFSDIEGLPDINLMLSSSFLLLSL